MRVIEHSVLVFQIIIDFKCRTCKTQFSIFPAMEHMLLNKNILITGGTSGLGRSLVKLFLEAGSNVIVIGRNGNTDKITHDNYAFHLCDLADMEQVKNVVEMLADQKISIDGLINNAGVLSPPKYIETINGHEFSYQVNFLSHVLLTRLLFDKSILKIGFIVNISSPIYTKGQLELKKVFDKEKYGLFQAYSNTKLFMALFSEKLANEGISSFSFNPGTFSSGIYQLQNKWFHIMYKIASPFMISSDKVAKGLFQSIKVNNWESGNMINRKGTSRKIKMFDKSLKADLWDCVDTQLNSFTK